MDFSKTDSKKDRATGNIKDTVGGAVGNESLQSEGKAQNTSGQAQGALATAQGYVAGAADQVSGAAKGAVNSLTGNNSGEAGNKFQEKKVQIHFYYVPISNQFDYLLQTTLIF
ncbi:hypothetical protein INT46_008652 [Mucor plumbeus]|uniref:CsbD-like domain-containing protein n=1 Tax=Mucor plumbeus TaxID=97098 RepID=A0A8H7VA30_9FUNG|nr:hypothetical protein INT46_008652 [Mucor plumbeus]